MPVSDNIPWNQNVKKIILSVMATYTFSTVFIQESKYNWLATTQNDEPIGRRFWEVVAYKSLDHNGSKFFLIRKLFTNGSPTGE